MEYKCLINGFHVTLDTEVFFAILNSCDVFHAAGDNEIITN